MPGDRRRTYGWRIGLCLVALAAAPVAFLAVRGGSSSAPPAAAASIQATPEDATPASDESTTTASTTTTTNAVTSTTTSSSSTAPRAWISAAHLREQVQGIAARTGADVGVVVRPLDDGPPTLAGPLQIGAAWSTMKVPVIMARYRLAAATGQSPDSFDADVVSAITQSDNEAVLALFDQIAAVKGGVLGASRYVQAGLVAAGDSETVVNAVAPPGGFSTFGQTQWSLSAGTAFYRALANGCLAPQTGDRRVLALMGQIEPLQAWALGQTHFRGVERVLFKGGWGPAPPAGPYTVRQFGIVRTPSGHGFVVGLMTIPADGTFASGIEVLDQLGAAVASNADASLAPVSSTC